MKRLVLVSLIGIANQLYSQNLVLNPGFETKGKTEFLGLGFDFFQFFAVNNWITPTGGSSDYFFTSPTGVNFPLENYGGVVNPYEGNAFAGIIPWQSGVEYREYLQGQLSETPIKGKTYTFSMFIATGNGCGNLVEELGVYFSATRIVDKNSTATFTSKPQVKLSIAPLINNPKEWQVVCGSFVATGTEKYFTLGNFNSDVKTTVHNRTEITNSKPWCYYYIDNVSLKEGNDCAVKTTSSPAFSGITQSIAPGKTYVASTIYFDTDKSTLKSESYPPLYAILGAIKNQPEMKIEIDGYSDSTGTEIHNQKLSEARAKAIASFLIENGIDAKRIVWKGFGSTKPVSDDNDKNRRVEFVFS
jgi:outer membrane protein OmpA-like peptidoglycan-associated protein